MSILRGVGILMKINRLVVLLFTAFLMTGCASGNDIADQTEIEQESITILSTETMNWYDSENDADILSEKVLAELPLRRSEVFYYFKDDLEVILYVDEDLSTSYVLINGQKLILSAGNFDYYLRYVSAPAVCLFDLNGDSILDVMISDHCDRAGMVQNIYMSEDNGLYTELGTVVWNVDSFCEQFSYQILLLDHYEAHVETKDFEISETVKIDYDFQQVAADLGLYDDNGKLTEYGKTWESPYQIPLASEISYAVNDDGQVMIRVISPIAAGYSSYELGCGFIFDWTIVDNQYQLLNVEFFSST